MAQLRLTTSLTADAAKTLAAAGTPLVTQGVSWSDFDRLEDSDGEDTARVRTFDGGTVSGKVTDWNRYAETVTITLS